MGNVIDNKVEEITGKLTNELIFVDGLNDFEKKDYSLNFPMFNQLNYRQYLQERERVSRLNFR